MAFNNAEAHIVRGRLLSDCIHLPYSVRESGLPPHSLAFLFHKQLRELASSSELLTSNSIL